MVKRCFTCQTRTEQKCGRCGRKCCDDHLYHATSGPIPEVCWQCAREEDMIKSNALGGVFAFIGACIASSFVLFYCGLEPCGSKIPTDALLAVCLVLFPCLAVMIEFGEDSPSSKAQQARNDRFWQRFTALRAWLGAAGGPGTSTRPAPGPARRASSADGSGCRDPPGASGPAEHSQSGTAEAH
jgi:hypothetical protein